VRTIPEYTDDGTAAVRPATTRDQPSERNRRARKNAGIAASEKTNALNHLRAW
jgi:hypothetical protein